MGMYQDIQDFHSKFGLEGPSVPTELDSDTLDFRMKFMEEELDEFSEAWNTSDMEKQFDALIDLVYVALGTAHMMGLNFDEGWKRVHEANMKKVRASSDGSNSKRGSSLDVVKPEGWVAPDLSDLV